MQRGRRGGRDRIEDAEQRVAVRVPVPQNQLVVVQIVARVHPHAVGEARAELDFASGVEQRELDPVDHTLVITDDRETSVRRHVSVARPPVALEVRVEHLAEPVQNDGPAHLPEDGPIHAPVIVRGACRPCQCPTRHEDHAAAFALDVPDLLLVGPRHGLQGHASVRRQVVGARAARDPPARRPRLGQGAADQLARGRPAKPPRPAALGGIHRFGDRQPERPEVAAVGERGLPVERRLGQRIAVGQRIGHHVRCGEGDAALDRPRGSRPGEGGVPHDVRLNGAVGAR